jgi:hypothetical protein
VLREDKLEKEVVTGSAALYAYETFIKDFISARTEMLFSIFKELNVQDVESLQETKRMLVVLNSLESDIKSIIETGHMAQLMIDKKEKH